MIVVDESDSLQVEGPLRLVKSQAVTYTNVASRIAHNKKEGEVLA